MLPSCSGPAFPDSDGPAFPDSDVSLAEFEDSGWRKTLTLVLEAICGQRSNVPETTTKKGSSYPVGPIVLGFFIFVVIGSSLFQIIRTATSGGMA
ncbi:Stress-associated endoplasmic reticulum protein 2 [Camellia lanceoleosa]|uniref:Stress-associated endoplasmic reticulum protein 2 n=1 Tax=Camellia lanceoleosa TaxID=1840588 RepID=A0ACC0I6U7_9ERIC|nr:Stress-associated endoplasmic reticulum protein 2 [Camellia lanceoleosa]